MIKYLNSYLSVKAIDRVEVLFIRLSVIFDLFALRRANLLTIFSFLLFVDPVVAEGIPINSDSFLMLI